MNTYLNNLYLKLSKFDVRYVSLALMLVAALASGHVIIMGLPISGDVGIK